MPMPRAPYLIVAAFGALLLIVGATAIRVETNGQAPAPPSAPAPAPVPPPPPQPHWAAASLRQLLDAVEASRNEGLRPEAYHRDELAQAVAAGQAGPDIAAVATAAAHDLAHDYAEGRVGLHGRFGWHIEHAPMPDAVLDTALARAVDGGTLPTWLAGLLPNEPRYVALRQALHDTPEDDTARRDHIRASMERWRWMPRALRTDYIWVNIPTYSLVYYQAGQPVATHNVVVGKPKTPTPMLEADAKAIMVNPWWTLPPSVLAEGKVRPGPSASSKGYVFGRTESGGLRVRQRPGPNNSLGRLKFEMPNGFAIYLHDTPAKALLDKQERALSHGCIRVKDIDQLVDRLVDPQAVDAALETTRTKTIPLTRPVPVYIVYFTAAEDEDGKVVTLGDPYGQDDALVAALDRLPRAATTQARKRSADRNS